jgi:hypothetical protein
LWADGSSGVAIPVVYSFGNTRRAGAALMVIAVFLLGEGLWVLVEVELWIGLAVALSATPFAVVGVVLFRKPARSQV